MSEKTVNTAGFEANQELEDEDSLDLWGLLDTILNYKWLILLMVLLAGAIGYAYTVVATPIYSANNLIQVDMDKGFSIDSLVGESMPGLSGLGGGGKKTAAEIEILKSRDLLGKTVDDLQLTLFATPRYVPYIGRWLASTATQLSEPEFAGIKGVVSGNEKIEVDYFKLPKSLQSKTFKLVLNETGYELGSDLLATAVRGTIGQPAKFTFAGQPAEILVRSATGKPGAEFIVVSKSRQQAIEDLQRQIKVVEKGRQSGILELSLEGAERNKIIDTLDFLANNYVEQNLALKSASADKTLSFLNKQLPDLRRKLEDSESKLNVYRAQNKIFDLDTEAKALLEQNVTQQVKIFELEQMREVLKQTFTDEHPRVKALDAQISAIKSKISVFEVKGKAIPATQQELLRHMREVRVNTELYTNLLSKWQQLRILREGGLATVRVVDTAAATLSPIRPKKEMILLVSIAAGLGLGMLLALLLGSLKSAITDPDSLERNTAVPIIGTLPQSAAQVKLRSKIDRHAEGVHILADQSPDDLTIEALRSLQTALDFTLLDAANNIVMIGGPSPGLGKSFVSINLAAVLAKSNRKILLIDADLRRGHLHQYVGKNRGPGLTELMLGGSAVVAEVIHKAVVPNLDIITTGTLPPNPSEMMSAFVRSQLLLSLEGQYDIIIIDAPPILAVNDSATMAGMAGTTLMVVRSEFSHSAEVKLALKRFSNVGVKVAGIVFNGMNTSSRRYGKSYQATQYYNYQYSQVKESSTPSRSGGFASKLQAWWKRINRA